MPPAREGLLNVLLNVSILVSDTTYGALKGEFLAKNLGSLALPGRKGEVTAWAIDITDKS